LGLLSNEEASYLRGIELNRKHQTPSPKPEDGDDGESNQPSVDNCNRSLSPESIFIPQHNLISLSPSITNTSNSVADIHSNNVNSVTHNGDVPHCESQRLLAEHPSASYAQYPYRDNNVEVMSGTSLLQYNLVHSQQSSVAISPYPFPAHYHYPTASQSQPQQQIIYQFQPPVDIHSMPMVNPPFINTMTSTISPVYPTNQPSMSVPIILPIAYATTVPNVPVMPSFPATSMYQHQSTFVPPNHYYASIDPNHAHPPRHPQPFHVASTYPRSPSPRQRIHPGYSSQYSPNHNNNSEYDTSFYKNDR
jgi:hypothetical protein